MTRRKLIREIEHRAGIQLIECRIAGNGHLRLRLASGAGVFASATPSCPDAIQHIVGDCRLANHQREYQ